MILYDMEHLVEEYIDPIDKQNLTSKNHLNSIA
jgi:hypothetical protein